MAPYHNRIRDDSNVRHYGSDDLARLSASSSARGNRPLYTKVSKGRSYDAAAAQLGLSFGAVHTTADLLTQIIYDLCAHPELIQQLREEVIGVLKEHGWKEAALSQMKLMDSVMKESQRLKPSNLISIRRLAVQPVKLSNGLIIPKGVTLAVSHHWHWDSSIYPDPSKFDGYRFLKMRQQNPQKEKQAHFVTTSPQHLGFGHGNHACPGRLFAADEVKILLAHLVLKYDFEMAEGTQAAPFTAMGWAYIANNAQMLIRRRKEEIPL